MKPSNTNSGHARVCSTSGSVSCSKEIEISRYLSFCHTHVEPEQLDFKTDVSQVVKFCKFVVLSEDYIQGIETFSLTKR